VTKLQDQPVYGLLKARPGGLVAQYPLLPAGYGDSTDVLYQQAHGHRIVNGYAETGFEDRRALTLYYLNQLRTARGLASLGVRYVIRPDDPAAFAGTPDPGLPRAGFELIGRGRYHNATASVYEVTAPPDAGYVYLRVGGAFWTEGPTEDPFVWVTDQEAELAVDAPLCTKRCRGELALRISSFGMPREVTLRLGRRVLWRGRVADRRDVAIPLEVDGRAAVTITTAPGPVRIQDLDPSSPDERSISVNLSRMRFTKAPARRSSP
jgi:hypothetical protein